MQLELSATPPGPQAPSPFALAVRPVPSNCSKKFDPAPSNPSPRLSRWQVAPVAGAPPALPSFVTRSFPPLSTVHCPVSFPAAPSHFDFHPNLPQHLDSDSLPFSPVSNHSTSHEASTEKLPSLTSILPLPNSLLLLGHICHSILAIHKTTITTTTTTAQLHGASKTATKR